ncbi:MAG TPA: YkuS family protein [Clostridiaceae bacterium]|jgi:hypothetical protein|nr:YkuS family protein [Clostridiaceae bacterium]
MAVTVGVESKLTPVREFLKSKGYNVQNIDFKNESPRNDSYDAYIVSGMSMNFMGMQDTNTKAVVINADGMTPEEVYDHLKDHFE